MAGKIKLICHTKVFFTVLAVFLSVGLLVYGGGMSASDAYDYPVKPGTDEWKALGSHEEMLKVCQIPDELLHTTSTAALVETVLNYPLSGDWWAYDSTDIGIKTVREQFNGLSELLGRSDAGVALIVSYQTVDPATIDIDSPVAEWAEYYLRIINIELLLSQDSVISNLSVTDLQQLISRARIIYESKLLCPELFGGVSLQFTSTIIEKASTRMLSL